MVLRSFLVLLLGDFESVLDLGFLVVLDCKVFGSFGSFGSFWLFGIGGWFFWD